MTSSPVGAVGHPKLVRVEWRWATRAEGSALTVIVVAGTVVAVVLAVFGFPGVDIHEPTHYLGIMVPSCGLTRGVVAFVRGVPSVGLRYNPATPVVLAIALGVYTRAGVGVGSRRWLQVRLRVGGWGVAMIGVLLIALWVNQQAHADFLG